MRNYKSIDINKFIYEHNNHTSYKQQNTRIENIINQLNSKTLLNTKAKNITSIITYIYFCKNKFIFIIIKNNKTNLFTYNEENNLILKNNKRAQEQDLKLFFHWINILNLEYKKNKYSQLEENSKNTYNPPNQIIFKKILDYLKIDKENFKLTNLSDRLNETILNFIIKINQSKKQFKQSKKSQINLNKAFIYFNNIVKENLSKCKKVQIKGKTKDKKPYELNIEKTKISYTTTNIYNKLSFIIKINNKEIIFNNIKATNENLNQIYETLNSVSKDILKLNANVTVT